MEETGLGSESGPTAKPDGWRQFRTAMCWLFGVGTPLGGLLVIASADGWTNEVVVGSVHIAGGPLFLPPILRRLRARWPQLRPRWVPIGYCFTLAIVAGIAAHPFVPSEQRIEQMEHVAMADAQTLLADHRPRDARMRLYKFAYRSDHDLHLAALLGAIRQAETASDTPVASALPTASAPPAPGLTETPQRAGSAYAERVRSYWLPAVAALPSAAPDDGAEFGKIWSKLDELVQDVADGASIQLSRGEAATRQQLIRALGNKQARLFPSMRRAYGSILRTKLFRDDVEVTVAGPRNSTIRQVGGAFSMNANIEDDEQASRAALARLRFHRSEYRWSRFLADGYHYDYRPPADEVVAQWDAGSEQWQPIK